MRIVLVLAQLKTYLVLLLLAATSAHAATISITPPTEWREDNTPIPAGTVFQYRLYGAVCNQPLKLLVTFTSLRITRNPVGIGSFCFEITAAAIDSNGVAGGEGAPSAFQIVNLPPEPEQPPPPPPARTPKAPGTNVTP
jgi:hypothetical protein